MTSEIGLFRRYLTGLLGTAVLGTSFLAMSAQAESLVLNCENNAHDIARQFRIDEANRTAQEINVPAGANPPGRAEITDSSISWTTIKKMPDGAGVLHDFAIKGSIDRLAGRIYLRMTNPANSMQDWTFSGECRQVTKRKF